MSERVLGASLAALAILFCVTVSAEHRDVAPIPDDVAQKLLTSFRIGKPSPLSETLSRDLDNASRLLTQITQSDQNNKNQSWVSQRMLLDATIQEIKTLRTEMRAHLPGAVGPPAPSSRDHTSFNYSDLVEERFNRVIQSLEAVRDSEKTSARAKALARAKDVLTDLHEAPRAQHESHNVGPTPTFTHRKPTYTGPDHLESAPEPKYLSRQHIAPDNLYAFNGDILLAALPSPTPAGAQTCNYTTADLGQSSEIQLTQEIKDLAASLGYSPVKIFQYVANEIAYEPYFGSLKGAMGTLYAKAGNPTDQASLLIALLRASNIPARYVLGTIQFDNESRVLRWLGAKDYPGAQVILQEGFLNPVNIDTTAKHIDFPHVWVEACVPYGNYRGSQLDTTGNRWIPLDPSFKDNTYQAGIAVNVAFDYTTYMAKRTNGPDSLPQEAYAKAVDAAVKTFAPNYANNTVEDVGYVGTLTPLKADILPASLPYTVKSFNTWDTGLTAETAEVPDAHRLKFVIGSIGFSTTSPPTFLMPDIILKRVTLSYRGVTSADQSRYETLLKDGMTQSNSNLFTSLSSNTPTTATWTVIPINLVPVIKLDGVEKYVGSSMNYWNITSTTCTNSTGVCSPKLAPVINSSQLAVTLNGYAVNQADFTKKINMLDVYALQAYGFQASDRLITERAQRLLNSVRTITDPNTNRDDTLGEFLHLVGLKYMRYLTDANKRIGDLDGGSGWSGNHIGQVSSDSKLQYLFDLPFAVEAPKWNLLVDVPGGVSRSVDLTTGKLVWKSFLLAGYAGSAYESYLWQENARLDAVSTVRGIQFANETGITMLTITSANQATELPKLTSNTNSTLNYTSGEVSAIQNLINQGYTVKLPRSHINYQNWKGAVWLTERNTATQMNAGFNIGGGYAGGYTVGSILDNSFNQSLNTGYVNQTSSDWFNLVTTPPAINSWVGLGLTPGNTFAGDPVNLVTGNLYHDEKDIDIKGRGGLNIVFKRSYNSRATEDGPFGIGWTHSFNQFLEFNDAAPGQTATDGVTSSVVWNDGTGSQKTIQWQGSSAGIPIYNITVVAQLVGTPPQGYFFSTWRQGDGTYVLTEKNGLKYIFENVNGTVGQRARLIRITDRNGNSLTLSYVGTKLAHVTDGLNRMIFHYGTNNHITGINDWTSRLFVYDYDTNGNLSSFKNPLASAGKQSPVTYSYYTAADGQNLNHLLKRYTLPRGNGMTFEYYMNGKAFRHYTDLGETTTFTYNDFRRETVSTNERGFERHDFFDENGNPIQTVDENGGVTSYTYDPANPMNRISRTDPMGLVTQYVYDSNGNVTKITNPDGTTIEYSMYYAFNQPGKMKDTRGNYTLYQYDEHGNLLQETKMKSGYGATLNPLSFSLIPGQFVAATVNTYDSFGNVLSTRKVKWWAAGPQGPITHYDYNDTVNNVQGLNAVSVMRIGDKDGDGEIDSPDTAKLTYDALGRLKRGIDKDWQPVQYVYDDADRLVQSTDAIGRIRSHSFDANGNPSGESLSQMINGISTLVDSSSTSYDSSDRKSVHLDAGGFATRFQYNAAGNVIKITNPDNYSVSFEYDGANHVTKVYDQKGNAVTYTLDLVGRPRTVTDPNGNTIKYVYYGPERNGRLYQQIDGVERTTSFDYDANGNKTKVTDNLGNVTYATYDELNRLVRIAYPSNTTAPSSRPVTTYAFDTLGRLTAVATGSTDSSGSNPASDAVTTQMTYVYDDFGRMLMETDPFGHSWTYQYDLNNNVTQMTDANNQTTTYTWNYGHQLSTKLDTTGSITSYIRNAIGQPLVAQSPGVRYNYSYDYAHRLKSVTDSRGKKSLTYTYSPGGLLNSMIDSDGRRTDYTYDPLGRLSGIWAPDQSSIGFAYDVGGRLTEKWLPNGVDTRYGYNADNTLSWVENLHNGNVISYHAYTYDNAGNRSQADETVGTTTTSNRYVYDPLNRLTEVWDNATNTQLAKYGYSTRHNRTSQTVGGVVRNYQYDPTGLLLQQTTDGSSALTAGFVYDNNGNLCGGGREVRSGILNPQVR